MSDGREAMVMEGSRLAITNPDVNPDPVVTALARVLGGDLEAFDDLMLLTQPKVLGLAWRLLGDRDQARDAAQETFLRAYRHLGTFRPDGAFEAWLYRITVNLCNDHARKRGPVMADLAALKAPAHAGLGAEEALLHAERRVLVRQALGTLTPAERAALVLRDLEGLSTAEAAGVLGVRPVTVRSQISAARAKVQAFCGRLLQTEPGGSR